MRRASILLCLLLLPVLAWGRTWQVAKDGSGDFTVIQDALDVAAAGDTVLIGPGRYDDWQWVTTDGWTERVYAHVKCDDLTLIGAGADQTIIGPAEDDYDWHQERPKGIAVWGFSKVTVASLRIEHVRDGIYCWWMELDVSDAVFSQCRFGVGGILYGCRVDRCTFSNNYDMGFAVLEGSCHISIDNTQFMSNVYGVNIGWSSDIVLSDCVFDDNYASLISGSSSGLVIRSSTFSSTGSTHVYITMATDCVISDCVFERGPLRNIHVSDGSVLSGSGNILGGGEMATIDVAGGNIDFHGNHILNGGGYSVKVYHWGEARQDTLYLDLRDNYWGTTDRDQIAEWILDGHDIDGLETYVLFEPFADQPTPNEDLSWGELKRRYR